MSISAGKLDRKITIQRFTETTNEYNEPIQTWADFISVRAQRKDVSDGEKFAAGQVGSTLMARFTTRSSEQSRTIKPTDRISHEGAIWQIIGLKEAGEGRRRFIEITAQRDMD
ncbi:phage head closure protein [Nitratireductor basaltis]|uniref:Putative Phage head-tail adaptor n=1 Tax=Nitratireductor basaltis TaxID=472175 RepID=A0A084UBK0_9HYPH|nr:phage head closure protein [Nitratireductor basaltis]KFB10336.1 putative Phage head-tail adaptor [Nitratireductor basaltis]